MKPGRQSPSPVRRSFGSFFFGEIWGSFLKGIRLQGCRLPLYWVIQICCFGEDNTFRVYTFLHLQSNKVAGLCECVSCCGHVGRTWEDGLEANGPEVDHELFLQLFLDQSAMTLSTLDCAGDRRRLDLSFLSISPFSYHAGFGNANVIKQGVSCRPLTQAVSDMTSTNFVFLFPRYCSLESVVQQFTIECHAF